MRLDTNMAEIDPGEALIEKNASVMRSTKVKRAKKKGPGLPPGVIVLGEDPIIVEYSERVPPFTAFTTYCRWQLLATLIFVLSVAIGMGLW